MNGSSTNTSIQTTCPYCGVGCGVIANIATDQTVTIQGDPEHPANFGRLCSKGAALAETLSLDDRLLYPEIQGQRVSWDQALDHVAQRFLAIREQHGPDSIAFYVSGQLLTEDYYVANKWMKGYWGSAHIDTNSRLCMASAVAAHKRAFGEDCVPGNYEDLEQSDMLILAGSNLAWCHPVLYQRIKQAKQQRPDLKIIVIDPRQTATCDIADLHLALHPGTDAVLFNGLLHYVTQNEGLNRDFIQQSTAGFESCLANLQQEPLTLNDIAQRCRLPESQLADFYQAFIDTEKVVTVFSQGINQSSSGTDKGNAIINCHLATGKIGQIGCGPFSITGQPNAMGGREVGGLANTLAAHMDFNDANCDRVQRFWQSPTIARQPGLKALDLFDAMAKGQIKAIWIMATNPAVSLPDVNKIRQALEQCEFVVVSDCIRATDTTAYADVLLPAAAWGEKEGTVTNSERRISRQRAFLHRPGEAQYDWWIISQIAQRMGFDDGFEYQSPAEIFREHAALSAFENDGIRGFNLEGLMDMADSTYQSMPPIQWPVLAQSTGTPRLFEQGRFFTDSGKAHFITVTPKPPENPVNDAYPYILNTGRIRDQWHTMTRTGKTARLTAHEPEPFVAMHPEDAAREGLTDGCLVKLISAWGEMQARLKLQSEQLIGQIFAPMHWNDQFAGSACVGRVVNPVADPVSGQPESKQTPVRIENYAADWFAFLLSRTPINKPTQGYWTQNKGRNYWRYELAINEMSDTGPDFIKKLMPQQGEWLEYWDAKAGSYRAGLIKAQRLEAVVFASKHYQLPERSWLSQLFDENPLSDSARLNLLAGKPTQAGQDTGKIVCACFGIGQNTLLSQISSHSLKTVEEIGSQLKAGTNCGSCIPELKKLLSR